MNKRTIYGLLILAVGVLALAGSLGYFEVGGLWSTFWPVILIAIGLVNLIDQPRNLIFSGMLTVVGVVFLLRNLGYEAFERFSLWEIFWPLIIIFVGLQLLTSNSFTRIGRRGYSSNYDGDDLDIIRIFSGDDVVVDSQNFTGGDIVTIFGGADVDLRHVKLQHKPARIDVVSIFGGTDIIVPEDWRVKIGGVPIFGGWSNKTTQKYETDRPVDLEISAVTIFGGMDVKNSKV